MDCKESKGIRDPRDFAWCLLFFSRGFDEETKSTCKVKRFSIDFFCDSAEGGSAGAQRQLIFIGRDY